MLFVRGEEDRITWLGMTGDPAFFLSASNNASNPVSAAAATGIMGWGIFRWMPILKFRVIGVAVDNNNDDDDDWGNAPFAAGRENDLLRVRWEMRADSIVTAFWTTLLLRVPNRLSAWLIRISVTRLIKTRSDSGDSRPASREEWNSDWFRILARLEGVIRELGICAILSRCSSNSRSIDFPGSTQYFSKPWDNLSSNWRSSVASTILRNSSTKGPENRGTGDVRIRVFTSPVSVGSSRVSRLLIRSCRFLAVPLASTPCSVFSSRMAGSRLYAPSSKRLFFSISPNRALSSCISMKAGMAFLVLVSGLGIGIWG